MNLLKLWLLLWGCCTIFSCSKEEETPPFILNSIDYTDNRSSYSPLTAKLTTRTNYPVKTKIRVLGKNEAADICYTYDATDTLNTFPILGLYGAYNNSIIIQFLDNHDQVLRADTLQITTQSISEELPLVVIDVPNKGGIKKGLNLVNSFSYKDNVTPQKPFMFDQFGDIRWYLDFTNHPDLGNLYFDVGLIKLGNGHMVFGDANSDKIYEVNLLGEIINFWPLDGYNFHHTLYEKPNGNLLITVSDESKETVQDVIIELDRATGQIVKSWDIDEALQKGRTALSGPAADWFHANGLFYDASDHCIVVSGRTQGVVKLDNDNQIQWIIAPHREWGISGSGVDLNQFLLQPLDNNNSPILNPDLIDGSASHPDFSWNFYQHSPILLNNGNIMIFDNGPNRNFTGQGTYSRAVEYRIDPNNKTIQQMWTYGEDRTDDFSSIVSSVRAHENDNTVLYSPGGCGYIGGSYGKIIEVNKTTKEVLFEATVVPMSALYGITFHSVIRMDLYP